MLTKVGLSVAEKLGQATSLGYCANAGDTTDNQNDTDGIVLSTFTATSTSATRPLMRSMYLLH